MALKPLKVSWQFVYTLVVLFGFGAGYYVAHNIVFYALPYCHEANGYICTEPLYNYCE